MENESLELTYKRISRHALPITRSTDAAAGVDLTCPYDTSIPKKHWGLIKTGIQIGLPKGTYGRIAPRSGLALNHGINVGAGVIDPDYTGEIGVILFNHNTSDFIIKRGDRIAQLICEKIVTPILREVIDLPCIQTERGDKGFGSSGIGTMEDTHLKSSTTSWNTRAKEVVQIIPGGSRSRRKRTLEGLEEIPGYILREGHLEDILDMIVERGDYFSSQVAIDKDFFLGRDTSDILAIVKKYVFYPASYHYIYKGKICVDLLISSPKDSARVLEKVLKETRKHNGGEVRDELMESLTTLNSEESEVECPIRNSNSPLNNKPQKKKKKKLKLPSRWQFLSLKRLGGAIMKNG